MTIHTTPNATPPPEQADAEPTRRASRFDQRGIALQTVIIMVVMLAIAGTVAAVLLTRAADTTEQLEQTDDTYARADLKRECDLLGGTWTWDDNSNTDPDDPGTCAKP